jgi:ParB family transcriptional regulator, chromosome partitioning protein
MSELTTDSTNKRKGLGRGLGSLLGGAQMEETTAPAAPAQTKKTDVAQAAPTKVVATPTSAPQTEAAASQDKVWTLSIEKLKGGAYQPRKTFEKEALDELARSIKEHGILQPLVARPVGSGQFEIVAGERRWRAAQLAGLHEVPVLIRNYNNQKTLELSLIENLQREDLNPIEEAEGYQRLQAEFSLTQEQIAERVGKERATVANSLRLLKLAPEVRVLVQAGELSQGHAKVILGLADLALQKKLALLAIEQQISVRKLESMVAENQQPKKPTDAALPSAGVTQRLISGLSDEMQKLLGTKVSIDYKSGKGKMSIHFYSDDELTAIVEKLRGAQR